MEAMVEKFKDVDNTNETMFERDDHGIWSRWGL